jgi:hypothetical protein
MPGVTDVKSRCCADWSLSAVEVPSRTAPGSSGLTRLATSNDDLAVECAAELVGERMIASAGTARITTSTVRTASALDDAALRRWRRRPGRSVALMATE